MKPLKRNRSKIPVLFASLIFIFVALALGFVQWRRYMNLPDVFPAGSTWGDFDVSGMSYSQALEQVQAMYATPVDLKYADTTIQATPSDLGFGLNSGNPEAGSPVTKNLAGFWNFLWNKPVPAVKAEISTNIDEGILKKYLQEQVAARLDQIPTEAVPNAGKTTFTPGQPGYQLDVDASLPRVEAALNSLDQRSADLVVDSVPAGGVSSANLEVFLKQKLAAAGFNGIAETYTVNLKTGQAVHFAVRDGQDITPDIAFSGASTIKIPILVSVMRRLSEPVPDNINTLIEQMLILSENPPADDLMSQVIGSTSAPLSVTEDMRALGLENTFLAGYFAFGSPLLQVFQTPANSRSDVNLDPDIYDQTTPADMVKLMTGIYDCAQNGTGLLVDTFPGEFSQSKCQYMLDVLKRNLIGVLTQAGVPEGTPVAHKHGWTEESDGYLHTLSDVAIVFSPDADYIFVVFLYDPLQLLFDPGNALFAQLSQVVYNANNLDAQSDWIFGPINYR